MMSRSSIDDKRIGVIVLTGFLGAGKTTLLNAILARLGAENCSLLINEFGEIGFDGDLVDSADDTMVEIANGCICCTVRGEVADAMVALAEHRRQWLIIETTGLANPGPLIETVLGHVEAKRLYRLQSVVTVVDALACRRSAQTFDEWHNQVLFADCLYLSKTDQFPEETPEETQRQEITAQLADINPEAPVFERHQLPALIECVGAPARTGNADDKGRKPVNPPRHSHHHASRFQTLVLDHDRPLPGEGFALFLDLVASAYSDQVLRMKGMIHLAGEATPFLLQSVGRHYQLTPAPHGDQNHKSSTTSRIMVILHDMEPGMISKLFAGFIGKTEIDTPDQQALSDNPLAIAGDWKIS